MYIDKVKIVKPYRSFKGNEVFECRPLNIIVGDQGCGKSTLLQGLQRHENFIDVELSARGHLGVDTYYFDTESMNPRLKDPISYSNIDGTNKGIGVGTAVASRFKSHGEILVCCTVEAMRKGKSSIVFVDEPESGLSLKNQYLYLKEMEKAIKRECQLFIATHSLVLIEAMDEVLSLEHGKWMKSKDFIESNKSELS